MNTYMNDLFNSLYKKYYKSINGYFSKRFDKNESEDLTQQTFIKLWAYLPTIEIIENEKMVLEKIDKFKYIIDNKLDEVKDELERRKQFNTGLLKQYGLI